MKLHYTVNGAGVGDVMNIALVTENAKSKEQTCFISGNIVLVRKALVF